LAGDEELAGELDTDPSAGDQGEAGDDDSQPGDDLDAYDRIDADEDTDSVDADDAADVDASADDETPNKEDRATLVVVQPSRPGDRKVMTIKAVIAEHGDDGATTMQIVAESGIGDATVSRLLAAMEQADAVRRLPGTPRRWISGPTKASEVAPNPEPARCPLCSQLIKGLSESPEAVSLARSLARPDGTLHVVAEDGTVHAVTLPKRIPVRATGFAAGAARRTDGTANADGSQPFAKGELERLTFDTLKTHPGRTMTPQEIATAISGQLDGRAVSSGAVRNNCGKLGSAGRILLVSESPMAFQFPAPAKGGADQADDATGEQSSR
jgi:hypothetical protein